MCIRDSPKTVCCRYNPGGVFELGNGIMDNPGDAKYGMSEDQMLSLIHIYWHAATGYARLSWGWI